MSTQFITNQDRLLSDEIALRYLKLIAGKYDHYAFKAIHMFTKNYLEVKTEECLSLWKVSVKKEREFLNTNKQEARTMSWWGNHYNGEILQKIKEKQGDKEFLEWLLYLSEYPDGFYIGDINECVKMLSGFTTEKEQVEKIFSNLIRKNASISDLKQKWIEKNSK